MSFKKYQHLERLGSSETEGILNGDVYVFPKLDGSNGQIYCENGVIKTGSRNRELGEGEDNQGFNASVQSDERYKKFFADHPNLRLYGEYLVKHTIKDYVDKAWREFYVFDVCVDNGESVEYINYHEYFGLVDKYGIKYIPLIALFTNPTNEELEQCLDEATYLLKDGFSGEGIVIKNYNYHNKYGRQTWAKIINSEFNNRSKAKLPSFNPNDNTIEKDIVENFITEHFVLKEQSKIVNEIGEWNSKLISRLLNTVYYEFIKEEMWNILKQFKSPKIDFSILQKLTFAKIKDIIKL